MFNSSYFTVKNILVIAILSLVAIKIFNHFSKSGE